MVVNKPPPTGKIQPAPQWAKKAGPAGGAQKRGGAKLTKPTNQAPAVQDNRDPKGINAHIKINFEDVIAERGPETNGARSKDCVWRTSYSCYTCWKNCLYKLFTLFCGVCLACGYGCEFSLYAFPCIWFVTPFWKFLHFCLVDCCAKYVRECAFCVIGVPCESCAEIFWPFRGYKKEPLIPYTRFNKVKFNDKVKTKQIPRNNAGVKVGAQRPGGKVAPAAQVTKPGGRR